VTYAAADALASLRIFEALLLRRPLKTQLNVKALMPDMLVEVLIKGVGEMRVAAKGRLLDRGVPRDGRNALDATVRIEQVLVPGALVPTRRGNASAGLGVTLQARLNADVVWPICFLRLAAPSALVSGAPTVMTAAPSPTSTLLSPVAPPRPRSPPPHRPPPTLPTTPLPAFADTAALPTPTTEAHPAAVLGDNEAPDVLHRIIKDVFHLMDMMYLPVHHGAKAAFYRDLRDAILVPDATYMTEVLAVLRRKGISENGIKNMLMFNHEYFIARVPRFIPPPSVLVPAVRQVFNTYGSVLDAKTGQPLFNEDAWAKSQAVLQHCAEGCISDIPGVQLYFEIKKDSDGLMLFRCGRGTNSTENIHQKIVAIFGSFHTGLEYADAVLAEHRHLANCRAAIKNRLGVRFFGHYDLWIVEHIQVLSAAIYGAPWYPEHCSVAQFRDTGEVFGIGPVHAFDHFFDHVPEIEKIKLSPAAHFFAERLGLRLPPLPVSTEEEAKLFSSYLKDATYYSGGTFKETLACVDWNAKRVDGVAIFPKTPSLLRHYFDATFKRNLNIRNTAEAIGDVQPIKKTHARLMEFFDQSFLSGVAAELCVLPSARVDVEYAFSNSVTGQPPSPLSPTRPRQPTKAASPNRTSLAAAANSLVPTNAALPANSLVPTNAPLPANSLVPTNAPLPANSPLPINAALLANSPLPPANLPLPVGPGLLLRSPGTVLFPPPHNPATAPMPGPRPLSVTPLLLAGVTAAVGPHVDGEPKPKRIRECAICHNTLDCPGRGRGREACPSYREEIHGNLRKRQKK
jgi:hypothetical protein